MVSGLFNTAQHVGGALGLAFLTRLATLDSSPAAAMATLDGYHLAFAAAAGLSAVSLLLALPATATTPRPRSDDAAVHDQTQRR